MGCFVSNIKGINEREVFFFLNLPICTMAMILLLTTTIIHQGIPFLYKLGILKDIVI